MSSWQGANAVLSTNKNNDDDRGGSGSGRGSSGAALLTGQRMSNNNLYTNVNTSQQQSNMIASNEIEEETVEAVLNRLMKSYNMAMECINTFHKLDTVCIIEPPSKNRDGTTTTTTSSISSSTASTSNDNNDNNSNNDSMKHRLALLFRVGRAARQTFEHAIFINPFIVAATTTRTTTTTTLSPFTLAPSHLSTVRQIAYLSYINYADLLLMGLSSSLSNTSVPTSTTILDRGVVKSLRALSLSQKKQTATSSSCWGSSTGSSGDGDIDTDVTNSISTDNNNHDESEETTIRLAMKAYMDALSMDASDPTVYIKLACATRRLNRLLLLSKHWKNQNNNRVEQASTSNTLLIKYSPYRTLERYALECAMTALPMNHVPVNRTAQQALQEWWDEENNCMYEAEIPDTTTLSIFPRPQERLTIALPRYSWSTFGRMLLRACKDGTSYQFNSSRTDAGVPFMSPTIHLQLSPLIALPTILLSKVVSFLSPKQLWPLEATCRALSASMVSVRVLINKNSGVTMIPYKQKSIPTSSNVSEKLDVLMPEVTIGIKAPSMLSNVVNQSMTNEVVPDETVEPIKRKSSRVQSQMITSGKRTERQNRRNSIEFCFLATMLGCNSMDDPIYVRLVQSYNNHVQQQSTSTTRFDSIDPHRGAVLATDGVEVPSVVTTSTKTHHLVLQYFWNEASLYSFIHDSIPKLRHQSPIACMFRFVAHASIYASQVFAATSDTTSLLDMQAHMLDCLEWMNQSTNLDTEMIACWSLCKSRVPRDANIDDIQLFAIDLLHAELRLRRCEIEELENCDFDSDSNFTSIIISPMLEYISTMDERSNTFESMQANEWKKLKTRWYWMVASWYFWRGRRASNVGEARQAEEEGLSWVEKTKSCVSGSEAIQTPHLSSTIRKEQHWKDLSSSTLSSFTDEVQASAVVLLAQERFLDVAASFTSEENIPPLEQMHCDALSNIGETLMERYSGTFDKFKSVEVIENFLSVHGEKLSTLLGSNEDTRRNWFADIVPSMKVEPSGTCKFPTAPAILTIFVTCLRTKDEHTIAIVEFLSRLVITLEDLSSSILARQKIQWDKKMNYRNTDDLLSEYESDMDDDFLSVDEDGEMQNRKQKLSADDVKLQKYSTLVRCLLQRILSFCKEALSLSDQLLLMQSNEFASIITSSLAYTSELFRSSQPMLIEDNLSSDDFGILIAIQELFQFIQSTAVNDTLWYNGLAQEYIEGMFHVVVVQRQVLTSLSQFKPNKNGRNERLRATRKRADLVATVCFDIGCFLSSKLASFEADRIVCSAIVTEFKSTQSVRLAAACDAIIWFWKAATDVNASDPYLSSYLDEFGRERLRVPLAMLIVGLCGSTLSESPVILALSNELVSLTEFYDSDASVVELIDDLDRSLLHDSNKNSIALLRVIIQAVYCVCNVFGTLDEKESCSYSYIENYVTMCGPGLPLLVARVLNVFANRLLQGFDQNDVDGAGIWGDYALGTRSVGFLLDSTLWKTYKCLHGFVLTNETKDSTGGITGSTGAMRLAEYYLPENKEAAAMLYRCIMRTYALGRRSPPKAALETVLAALPHVDESKKSTSIRQYLFSTNIHSDEMDRLLSLALLRPGWNDTFATTDAFDWIYDDDSETSNDETSLVRRGLARLMAHGPLPRLQDIGDEKDWRSASVQSEEDLSTKFNAVVDDLSFGDATDWEGWFKASQCLNLKSDLIADRLGLSRGFTRNPKFSFKEKRGTARYSCSLSDLKAKHDREQCQHDNEWIQCIGADLSIFIRYHWSSFSCLKNCHYELERFFDFDKKSNETDSADDRPHSRVWLDIKTLFGAKDFGLWQQALGGLFVSSLRLVAYRCLSLALYMSNRNDRIDCNVPSELAETLGVNLYVELMGSQSYGYPMKILPFNKRRDLAFKSLACFERAITCMQSDKDSRDKLEAWSLYFMVGKCHEKIARSFENEAFTSGSEAPHRLYEHHMSLALNSYAESVAYASKMKESGGFISEQNGGSSHGALEAFYRLHASRLKCLISAIEKSGDEKESAEQEALRLTECHMCQNPEKTNHDSGRHRIWEVFEDIVGALAKCSLDHSYFHRSVYRHAQALMWAPLIYDPIEARAKGSLGNVPATWACKIRGLNPSTDAASSGLSVISSLFTKKRTQLVAVWVTMDSETTPFETINRSARKYDSLRGKYIAAYIDSLRICRRRKELDLFLSWTTSCPRDLPSYFAASALLEGGVPTQAPTFDSLVPHYGSIISIYFLKAVRRLANSSLAKVILDDMNDHILRKNFKQVETVKFFETQLKIAYACFLRLNCDFEELTKRRSWLYETKQSGLINVVEALTIAYTNLHSEAMTSSYADHSDWSGESQLITIATAALQKCKELYPSLSRNFSFTRQRAPTKPKSPSSSATSKRKLSQNHEKKSFEVAIPEGLKEGDTFLTSIAIGDTKKRVRLTVPSESASSLRFSLEVPIKDVESTGNSGANANSGSKSIE